MPLTSTMKWLYVRTAMKIARGATPEELFVSNFWPCVFFQIFGRPEPPTTTDLPEKRKKVLVCSRENLRAYHLNQNISDLLKKSAEFLPMYTSLVVLVFHAERVH